MAWAAHVQINNIVKSHRDSAVSTLRLPTRVASRRVVLGLSEFALVLGEVLEFSSVSALRRVTPHKAHPPPVSQRVYKLLQHLFLSPAVID